MPKAQKILVLGSGGREHALCWHLQKFGLDVECAPGSDGISLGIPCWNFENFQDLASKIKARKIELVIVGPEKYLAEGVADALTSEGISVFGPTKKAAQLESDKAFAKDFCLRHKIPVARTQIITKTQELEKALSTYSPPYVLKASGLAAGKGVWIGEDLSEATTFVADALKSHPSIVIEEFLIGEELSYFAMVDGPHFCLMGAAQDHKRLLENDRGPNTGGMGAYSPVPILDSSLEAKIIEKVLKPTVAGLQKDGVHFRGFVFLGMMICAGEPYLLEYNCRMGDPETQALMLRLQTPLSVAIESLHEGRPQNLSLSHEVSLNVVVAAKGYPDFPQQNFVLAGLENALPKDCLVFHSGTKKTPSGWVANGGRLFSINALQSSLLECQQKIYPWIESLQCQDKITFRRDIAVRAFKHLLKT